MEWLKLLFGWLIGNRRLEDREDVLATAKIMREVNQALAEQSTQQRAEIESLRRELHETRVECEQDRERLERRADECERDRGELRRRIEALEAQ